VTPSPSVTALFLLSCFAPSLPLASKDGDAPPAAKEVIDGWVKREPAIRSLRFRWVEVTTTDTSVLRRRNRTRPLPQKMTLESKATLTIDGDRMRFERVGPGYNERHGGYVNQIYISTYNVKASKAFYDMAGTPWRAGFVLTREDNQDCDNYNLRPMMLFCMPLSPKYRRLGDAGGWKLDSTTREIQGHPCRALIKGDESYWFDPSRGNAILLYEYAERGVALLRQEIFYSEDAKYGLIPSRWTSERYAGKNILIESTRATARQYEINKNYSDEVFDIAFPPGTEVSDDREKRFYRLEADWTKQDIVR
jgi:hypothetical protein